MEKINVAELLKDCPKGMELDCTMFSKVTLINVDNKGNNHYPIKVEREDGYSETLTKYGQYADVDFAKCVIFPKGKTTWEGFVPPCKFKDGDITTCTNSACTFTSIFKVKATEKSFQRYCSVLLDDNTFRVGVRYADYANPRFATEEEKAKLFQAINDNGYKWNAETKTLEKLSPNKFDINTLIPFESKVLVRNANNKVWRPNIFGCYMKDKYEPFYVLGGTGWKQCIPYEGNEHLIGKTDDCDEYFKTWK